jgi:iron complex outermembrane recepter protein
MKQHYVFSVALLILSFLAIHTQAQSLSGTVVDYQTGDPIPGASVLIKGTPVGVSTDGNGAFQLPTAGLTWPQKLVISFIGYENLEVDLNANSKNLKIRLRSSDFNLDDVTVVETRLTEKQKEEPLTVETMDVIAIKEAPSGSFYDNLGNLKGVDLTAASIGFKVINTRGFNSTSPVRTLQIIDGVDNQAPGLNFSLGNFLGASDLDVMKVEVIAGASSAFYGPNAFNGVISMTTKDPFQFQGISASVKVGERALTETAVRWAQVWKNKEGEDKFALKLNLFYLRANDWEADNYSESFQSEVAAGNPGGWDAINIYGDEDISLNNNSFSSIGNVREYPGLGTIFRTGYKEVDLVDYNTRNGKFSTSLHYKFNEKTQLVYAFNYGTGTTIYQGDNRYSLKNIQFFQNRIELKEEGKYFIRAYATNENAGDSYDAVFTAIKMQEAAMANEQWINQYSTYWASVISPQIKQLPGVQEIYNTPGPFDTAALYNILALYPEELAAWHEQTRGHVDGLDFLDFSPYAQPGSPEYDSLFSYLTTTTFDQGGTRFYDKSALYHVHGEYRFKPSWAEVVIGSNFRQYRPQSNGTIFNDTLVIDQIVNDDTTYVRNTIVNSEWGAYVGFEKRFIQERMKANVTMRVDKNQNFDYLFSPAASMVFNANENNTFRATFSSAIRNPTLQDQYLYYNVGRAILLGNLDGYDSLVTVESFGDFINSQKPDTLNYFSVDPIRPEQVKTIELGYRGTLGSKWFIDLGWYYSWYRDFIGFNIGLDMDYNTLTNLPSRVQAYRIASNAKDGVTTTGLSIGANYYWNEYFTLMANYSYNVLNLQGSDDPIIPAFNTPPHKFNIGIVARDLYISGTDIKNIGFGINYKWIDGFMFEGSPQFTGEIQPYGLVDAQVNYTKPEWHTTFKLGASNLLNNKVFMVYGGPYIGRLAYFSILFDWDTKK